MKKSDIPVRSDTTLSAEDYSVLQSLYHENKWLIRKNLEFEELWSFCDDSYKKSLLLHLVKEFEFIDTYHKDDLLNDISKQIESVWGLEPCDTIIAGVENSNSPDGSHSVLQSLKNRFEKPWEEKNFVIKLSDAVTAIKSGGKKNLIFIDDFIGTGSKVSKKREWVKGQFEKGNIPEPAYYCCALASMGQGKDVLADAHIHLYSALYLKRGISDYFSGAEKDKYDAAMQDIESQLSEKYKRFKLSDYSFGYKSSEALLSIDYDNIPNNVFPIFWWPENREGYVRKTIFRRLL